MIDAQAKHLGLAGGNKSVTFQRGARKFRDGEDCRGSPSNNRLSNSIPPTKPSGERLWMIDV
ncbi:hypothetical protein AB2C71_32280, partial [Pseudomonas aeruginosa]